MTTQPTDPRPAATEAAMSEGELLLLGALHAYFRGCDLMRSRATFDEVRDVIERYGDGYRLTVAASPSGQVVIPIELVERAKACPVGTGSDVAWERAQIVQLVAALTDESD